MFAGYGGPNKGSKPQTTKGVGAVSPSEGAKSLGNGNGKNSAQYISCTVFMKRKQGGKKNNEKYSNKQMMQFLFYFCLFIHEFVCENAVYLTGYSGPAAVPNGQSTKAANTGKHMCMHVSTLSLCQRLLCSYYFFGP